MQYSDSEKTINAKRLRVLLTPSWLSALMAILIAITITVGVIVTFNFHNSQLRQALLSYEHISTNNGSLTLPGESPMTSANNSLQSTWPLIAFWAMIGLAVYFVGEFIVKVVFSLARFREELNYVHVKRLSLITTSLANLAVSVIGVAIWLVYIDLFLKLIVPWSISLAHQAVTSAGSAQKIEHGLLSFVIIIIALHLNVVFLRLVFRKPRLFSSVEYLDV